MFHINILAAGFLVTIASSVSVQLEITQQTAGGQTDFEYFSDEARDVAEVFVSYLHKYDCAVSRHVQELKSLYTIHGQLVDECAATLPQTNTAELNKTVTESLVQVQSLDNTLRTNNALCFSLRVAQPQSCVDAREEALESLARVGSEEQFERVHQVLKTASDSARSYLDNCINVSRSL